MSKEYSLQEIECMLAGITPGEWHQRDPKVPSGESIVIDTRSSDDLFGAVAMALNFANYMSFDEGHKQCDAQMRRDAEFIAASPAIIRQLLEQLKDAKAEAFKLGAELGRADNEIVGLRESLQAERERCARIVESFNQRVYNGSIGAPGIAAAIRSRKDEGNER